MNITSEMINEIRNKLDIVEVISKYVPLTQHGKNYFGFCPFHQHNFRTPSMSVSKEKQIYTCFSCGASGNVFTFVSESEHIGFYDAVRLLGNQLGYNLGNKRINKDKNEPMTNEKSKLPYSTPKKITQISPFVPKPNHSFKVPTSKNPKKRANSLKTTNIVFQFDV